MHKIRKLIVLLTLLSMAPWLAARPLYGFTPFPYDATQQAVTAVHELLRQNATVHALHFDDGIPWSELLDGQPLPAKIQREWDDARRAIPPGRPVYLGLAPLAKDRKSLAPGRSETELPLPWSLKFAALDSSKVKAAYLEYARRAVRQFNPTYLNLGIEAGELAWRDPARWPQFEALYQHVAQALKREFPQLMIGISFGLQSLREPAMAQRVKALVDSSDYIGISFYPHASPFGERFGEPALRAGDEAWREPLAWLRAYTAKPIAICETGQLSRSVTLGRYQLTLRGDPSVQTRYVHDLAARAERDQYLFVVWFLSVDYDRLYARLGGDTAANEVNLMWRNIGLWDGDGKPKPALTEWQRALGGRRLDAAAPAAMAGAGTAPEPALQAAVAPPAAGALARAPALEVGFSSQRQLFQTGGSSQMVLTPDAVAQWTYAQRRSDWAWAVRELDGPLPAATQRMTLRLRSDHAGPLFVQVEERDGETFFTTVEPARDWSDLRIELSSLKPDPAKRRDGVLQPERIVKLLVADPAPSRAPAGDGQRTVWMARWNFE